MRRILRSLHHAASLLWNLGPRRFSIVLICWALGKYRPVVGAVLARVFPGVNREKISRDPILIYQMSKVGSTSLLYSLQFAYLKAGLPSVPLYHVHTLTNLALHEQNAIQSNQSAQHLALVRDYGKIRKNFEERPQQHWTAISIVRDPVARHVSDYFHHIDRHLPDWRRRWRQNRLTLDEVLRSLLNATDHAYQWFDNEIQSVLGISVFSTAFPHEAGYKIYFRPPKVALMVIRLEDMNRVAKPAIEQFLCIKQFKIESFNLASGSGYRDLYSKFKTTPLPAWYLEKAYSSKLAQHFYTDTERAQFAKKWSRVDP